MLQESFPTNSLYGMRHACWYTLNPYISMKTEVLRCWTYTNLVSLTSHFFPRWRGATNKSSPKQQHQRRVTLLNYATAPCWVFMGDSEHCKLQISRADQAGDASGVISALLVRLLLSALPEKTAARCFISSIFSERLSAPLSQLLCLRVTFSARVAHLGLQETIWSLTSISSN